MGLKRYRKKITRQVKATVKQVGPTVIQVVGAAAAPLTFGASLLASQAYAQGKKINEARNAAEKIEKENARIMRENEAYYAALEGQQSAKSAAQTPMQMAATGGLASVQTPAGGGGIFGWFRRLFFGG